MEKSIKHIAIHSLAIAVIASSTFVGTMTASTSDAHAGKWRCTSSMGGYTFKTKDSGLVSEAEGVGFNCTDISLSARVLRAAEFAGEVKKALNQR